jgi:small-conductance mechanosensitive channel
MNLSYKKIVPILFLAFFTSLFSVAQVDSLKLKKNDSIKKRDSINTSLLKDYSVKIKEIELQRINDSLKKIELENRLKSLNTSDNLQKEDLQKQLQALKNQENQRISDKKARIASLKKNAKGFPVMGFFKDTLFVIYSKLGSFSAADRADAISNRINELSDEISFNKTSLLVIEAEITVDIMFSDKIIMSISENDAIWNDIPKKELAKNYQKKITDAVLNFKEETSLSTLAKEIALALLVILIVYFLLKYCAKLFTWTAQKITDEEDKKIKGFTIKDYTLFDAKRLVTVILNINNVVKWLVIIVLIYIALPIIFGFFPWTKGFAETLFGYFLNPLKKVFLGIWNFLPNMFTIIVIFLVFRYAIKGIHFLKTEIEKENLKLSGFYPDWANPTFQILKVILYAFMFVLIFPYLPGSESPIFKGVSVFLGFLFTFGSAGSLSNIIAGIVLTYMRLFKIGDRVKIGEVFGDVIEKSMLVTRVKTIKNEIISIPNSTVMSSHTINYSNESETGQGLILHTTITIGYDVPWKLMHETLIKAADRTQLLLKTPKPFVLQTSLDDFYVSYQINAYTKDPNKQAGIYSDLHQNIQDCCNEAGIEILSPHYRSARDGNMVTIPASYLDKNYKAPSFNVNYKKEEN